MEAAKEGAIKEYFEKTFLAFDYLDNHEPSRVARVATIKNQLPDVSKILHKKLQEIKK